MGFDPKVSSGSVNKYGFEHEGSRITARFEKLPDFTKRKSVDLTGSVKAGEPPEGSNPQVLNEATSTAAAQNEVTPLFPEASADAETKMLELSVYEDPPDVEVISPEEFKQTMNEIMDSPLPPDRKLENLTILHNRILDDTASGLIGKQESEDLIDVLIDKMFPLSQSPGLSKTIDIAPVASFPAESTEEPEGFVEPGVTERPSNETIRQKIEDSSVPPEEKALMLQQLALQEQYDASKIEESVTPNSPEPPPLPPSRAQGQAAAISPPPPPTPAEAQGRAASLERKATETKSAPISTSTSGTRKRGMLTDVGRNVRRRCSGIFGRIVSGASYRLSQLSLSRSSSRESYASSSSEDKELLTSATPRKETRFSSFEEASGRNRADSEAHDFMPDADSEDYRPPRPKGPPPRFQLEALKEQINLGDWNGVREKLYDLRGLGDPEIQKEADAILTQMEEEAANAPIPKPIMAQGPSAPPPPPPSPPPSDLSMLPPTRPLSKEAFAAELKGATLKPTPKPKEKPMGQMEALQAQIKAGRPNLRRVDKKELEKPKPPPSAIESDVAARRVAINGEEDGFPGEEFTDEGGQPVKQDKKPSEVAPPPSPASPPVTPKTPKVNTSKFARRQDASVNIGDHLDAIKKGTSLKPVGKPEQAPKKEAASPNPLLEAINKAIPPPIDDPDSEDEDENDRMGEWD